MTIGKRLKVSLSVIVFTLAMFEGTSLASWSYDQGWGATGCDTTYTGPFGSLAACNADRSAYLASCIGPCCTLFTTSCSY